MPPTQPLTGPEPTKSRTFSGRIREGFAFLVTGLAALWKFKGALALLKLGGSMFLYIFLYGVIYNSWEYGIGVVVSIFLHEMGHYLALVLNGIEVTAMNFVPFVGAYVAYKNMPRAAALEASVALAGPLAGATAALICYWIFRATENPLFLALAYFGYFVNLINLIPIWILDGQKAALAISPGAWLAGIVPLAALELSRGHFNLPVLIIIALALGRIYQGYKGSSERRDRECTLSQSIALSATYFALVLLLGWLSNSTFNQLAVVTHDYMGD